MNFVQWATSFGLLLVGLGGLYGGVTSLAGRKVEFAAFSVQGRGTLLLALLYLVAGIVSLLALAGLLIA
ncbi:MAG TPA: hypothetical protein VEX13_11280 [Chloroflexia bacterium]|nr:hypothetical protein [Chloroflexia bacterium]